MELTLGKTSDDRGRETLLIWLFAAAVVCLCFAIRQFGGHVSYDTDPVLWNWIWLGVAISVGALGWIIFRAIRGGK